MQVLTTPPASKSPLQAGLSCLPQTVQMLKGAAKTVTLTQTLPASSISRQILIHTASNRTGLLQQSQGSVE